ncbi:MAG: hypothetical protein IPQ07_26025 [Myxococcales bacterium]|nr:hypothetical protein [Myxococcales bacterium]
MRRLPASLLLVAALGGSSLARSEKTLAYTRELVWPTAVRFLVVDEHVKVTDKDPDAGYVMFEIKEEGHTFRGSLEVMTVVRDKRTSVRFVLQIEDRPDWMEVSMLNRLERKLRSELGSPAPAPTDPKEPPPKDTQKDPPKPDEGGPPISKTP